MTIETRRQNLVLLHEENVDDRLISNNMVSLYMNRFLIDEEAQHEVIGVYNLNTAENSTFTGGKFNQIIKKITEKIPFISQILQRLRDQHKWHKDKAAIHEAFRRSENLIWHPSDIVNSLPCSITLYDTHFIIGTRKINNQMREWVQSWRNDPLLKIMKTYLIFTQLEGYQSELYKKEKNEVQNHSYRSPYYGPFVMKNTMGNVIDVSYDMLQRYHRTSISDDAEFLARRLCRQYNQNLIGENRESLKFNRILTDSEIQKMKFFRHVSANPLEIKACLSMRGPFVTVSGKLSGPFEPIQRVPDSTYQYLHCECERLTFICLPEYSTSMV